MFIHTESLFKQKIRHLLLSSCVDTLENLSKMKNPHAEHCSIARYECYNLTELISSHMNNKSCVQGYKEYDYGQWPTEMVVKAKVYIWGQFL